VSQRPFRKYVVVLDRDGTIIADKHYLNSAQSLEFLPKAADGLRELNALGFRLVVVTNQSGIGRGIISEEALEEIHAAFRAMLERAGARLEGIYHCPHAPQDNCRCRKPETGLLMRAASEIGFDPRSSIVIGDKGSDVELGRRVGACTILISPSGASSRPGASPDYIVKDLAEAGRVIAADPRFGAWNVP
jgi:D-glycero-D-manno-heptose 1,7-bisphosphate phosphatase